MADESRTMLSEKLGQAIQNGELERVRIYIEHGVDVNRQCIFGVHPLALACGRGHKEIMEELLKAGAHPNQVSECDRRPAMLIAAEYRFLTLSMMRCLISHGADVDFKDDSGGTILHYLARGQISDTRDNLLSAAKLVLDNGASFYVRDDRNDTSLYEACRSGNIDLVKLFLAEGADVNFDIEHMTMLRGAADGCDIDIFDLLVNAGANRQLTSDALVVPCNKNDHAMIARIMDTCDVDINIEIDISGYNYGIIRSACKDYGLTILHYACADRRVTSKTVRLLLDRGADVRTVSYTGDTALHYAVWRNSCHKIRQLLLCNPPLNIRNKKNQTPFLKFIHRLKDIQSAPYGVCVLIFRMFIAAADGKVPADVEPELIQLRTRLSEAQIPDFEISSEIWLQKMCRSVILGMIRVPIDSNVCTLSISPQIQEYLIFPEFDSIADECIKMQIRVVTGVCRMNSKVVFDLSNLLNVDAPTVHGSLEVTESK